MDGIKARLRRLLPTLRLHPDDEADLARAIDEAGTRPELAVIIAEMQAIAGEDLEAVADGLAAHGLAHEAARTRLEAHQAQAPFDRLTNGR